MGYGFQQRELVPVNIDVNEGEGFSCRGSGGGWLMLKRCEFESGQWSHEGSSFGFGRRRPMSFGRSD
jgi:hypothetical protein